ncbi:MAG: class I SAM-dependent methyltransferase, partial [Saprospiraceae bacterium]|nr:class I SAM-dependent methyltransferase [Saprospiraceae bacterium]
RMLFRLADWAHPASILEIGTSVGISTMYLASGALGAKTISLEGCPETAQVARLNLEMLGLERKVQVITGDFQETLPQALRELGQPDLVFIDGNHRRQATLAYFETCLAQAYEYTVFVFDDMHGTPEMAAAWEQIQAHPRVTMTVDFFDLSLAFINSDFKEKQHFKIVPSRWKFWKIL